MTHNPETTVIHYALYNQRELAVPVTNMISAVMEGKTQQLDNILKSIEMNPQSTVAIMGGTGGCLGNLKKSIHWPQEKETDNDTDSTKDYDLPCETKGHHAQRNAQKEESRKLIDKYETDKTIQS